ncbi:MAG: energy transducer TonB, partial [Nitrospirae bacterium]|nr:energy transducer TonB [Nitrospirota bacterium]
RKEIWQQWVFPDTGHKDLETIISIKIRKDGTITAQKIEKSSGNLIFDRSAIKAITKANPLSPPPYEMEIGVRFYP